MTNLGIEFMPYLEKIILKYRGDENEEPLDGDEVDRLVEHLRNAINLHEGNITNEEYLEYEES